MRCARCNTPVGETDQFCTTCGAALAISGGKSPDTIPAAGGVGAAAPLYTAPPDEGLDTMALARKLGARRSRGGTVLLVLVYLLLFGGSSYGVYAYLSSRDGEIEATLTLGTPRLVRIDEAKAADAGPAKVKAPARKKRVTRPRKVSTPGNKEKGSAASAGADEAPVSDDHGSGGEKPASGSAEKPASGGGEKPASGTATPGEVPAPTAPTAGNMERFNAESVRMVIKHYLPQLRVCYERATKQGGVSRGVVDIQFTISTAGKVTRARVHRNTTGNINLGKCIANAFLRWRFPRPAGGEAEFIYPFVFSSGG